jgi:diguanylate cyclase
MIQDLFVNGAIVITVISIGNQMLIDHDISPYVSWRVKLLFSTMAGVLGILLMVNSALIIPGVILDFRNIAILLSAVYCGFVPALITSVIIALFRLFYLGVTCNALIGSISALLVGVACGLISTFPINRTQKWVYSTLAILIIPVITFILIINEPALLIRTSLSYAIEWTVLSVFIYFYTKYIDILKYTYLKYQRESARDFLTGLNNVRQFDAQLNKIRANLTDDSFIAMLFIDVDFFKKVNDTYGHQNGDKVLIDLSKILLSKISNTDSAYRNGGEEFIVLMTDCPRDKVLEVAERIRKAVEEHRFDLLDGRIIHVTVSIGVAVYPDTVKRIDELVEKADEALYKAKGLGRNAVSYFDGLG